MNTYNIVQHVLAQVMRGNAVMKGYLKNPAATEKARL